jgi:hypothetical protein
MSVLDCRSAMLYRHSSLLAQALHSPGESQPALLESDTSAAGTSQWLLWLLAASRVCTEDLLHQCLRVCNMLTCDTLQWSLYQHCERLPGHRGFGSYVTALDHRSYDLVGPDTPGNRIQDVYEPHLRRVGVVRNPGQVRFRAGQMGCVDDTQCLLFHGQTSFIVA